MAIAVLLFGATRRRGSRSDSRAGRFDEAGGAVLLGTSAAHVVSMFLLAIPMVALSFAAYGVSALHDRAITRRTDTLSAQPANA